MKSLALLLLLACPALAQDYPDSTYRASLVVMVKDSCYSFVLYSPEGRWDSRVGYQFTELFEGFRSALGDSLFDRILFKHKASFTSCRDQEFFGWVRP